MRGTHSCNKSLFSPKDSQVPLLVFMSSAAFCNAVLLTGTCHNYIVHLLIQIFIKGLLSAIPGARDMA